jgi:hypothetical protein
MNDNLLVIIYFNHHEGVSIMNDPKTFTKSDLDLSVAIDLLENLANSSSDSEFYAYDQETALNFIKTYYESN